MFCVTCRACRFLSIFRLALKSPFSRHVAFWPSLKMKEKRKNAPRAVSTSVRQRQQRQIRSADWLVDERFWLTENQDENRTVRCSSLQYPPPTQFYIKSISDKIRFWWKNVFKRSPNQQGSKFSVRTGAVPAPVRCAPVRTRKMFYVCAPHRTAPGKFVLLAHRTAPAPDKKNWGTKAHRFNFLVSFFKTHFKLFKRHLNSFKLILAHFNSFKLI